MTDAADPSTPAVRAAQSAPPKLRRRGLPFSILWITTPALLVVFLGAWEMAVRVFGVEPIILPPPTQVAAALYELLSEARTWGHTWVTVYETMLGFLFGSIIGVGLGAVLGKVRWLERTLNPYIVATQVVPKVALVPLFVLWFGFGPESKVFTSAVLSFFPILTNTLLGIKSVDLGHRDVMRSLSASRWQTFRRLDLPSALPYILTGMEVGIVLAIIGAIVGEFLGGSEGLGYMAVAAMNSYQTQALFGVIIIMTVVGFIFYMAVVAAQRLIIPWHESVMAQKSSRPRA
jgi:NitT/TauT family transport system permease protein